MFAHSYRKLSRTCYGESTSYAPQKSSVKLCITHDITISLAFG